MVGKYVKYRNGVKLMNNETEIIKSAILFTYGIEIDMKDKDEVEEIIRGRHLDISLIESEEEGCFVGKSENYKHLWLLMFHLSCKSDWVIC